MILNGTVRYGSFENSDKYGLPSVLIKTKLLKFLTFTKDKIEFNKLPLKLFDKTRFKFLNSMQQISLLYLREKTLLSKAN